MRVRVNKRGQRGAALVEFAIVAPVLLLIMFGIFEFGLSMYRLQGVHAAARDAARIGASAFVNADEIEARAFASLGSTLLEQQPVVTITPDVPFPCADPATPEIRVRIETQDGLAIPFYDNAAITLASEAVFACER